MAFDIAQPKTPESIGRLIINLIDDVDDQENPIQTARYRLEVIYSDGSVDRREGDLVPHLDTTQRQGLLALMDDVRAMAETEILPSG